MFFGCPVRRLCLLLLTFIMRYKVNCVLWLSCEAAMSVVVDLHYALQG